MRLPRDLSGRALAQQQRRYGYQVTRETGSHMRLTTLQHGQHHVTIPDHKQKKENCDGGAHSLAAHNKSAMQLTHL